MAAETISSSSSSSYSTRLGPAARESDATKLRLIDEVTANADQVQGKVLEEILTRNAQTEYLQRFKLGGATDREVFKAKVPIVTYEDLKPDIQRIANGDQSPILTVSPISEFLTSSGTAAGERKLIPFTDEELQRRMLFSSLFMPVVNIYVPGLDKGKALYFLFVKTGSKTPGGLPARPALTSFFESRYFQARPYDPYSVYTSPNETILCPDSFQSMYAQILCGLCMRQEVLRIGSAFASGLLRAIHFLQLHWEELAADIASGTLSDKVTDPSVREAVKGVLAKPDPELARYVENECSKGEWEGIIPRIWPMTKYLDVIITGAMAQYIDPLNYYSCGLPIVCTVYAASECYIGINLRPMSKPTAVSFTIMPNMAYFEFLPVEQGDINVGHPPPHLVDLADVEVGKEYEIVVTTYTGLYRYRVGDILRVTGFHNAAPQFHFVRRKNVLLTIESDKTDETELQEAVQRASDILKDYDTTVVEYSSHADTKTIPGHYVIYFELLTKDPCFRPPPQVVERCCLAMENALNAVYRQSRVETGSIGPLEIRVVRSGTFQELMDYAISQGSSINQYKVPRCVNVPAIVELLDSRVVSTHTSQEAPFWPHAKR